mmetsp:Transcript_33634/g.24294  ORF Transcript_33634/g.24294 Transcript_33634/m.24294 type:complete len:107 (+) Transcript_33634:10-330(+)
MKSAQTVLKSTARSIASEEMVMLVDPENTPMGSVLRKTMRQDNLWHRASYIYIRDSQKRFYVQKRTLIKDLCPGYYDLCTGGVVGADEQDDVNAYRELEEEMGISQ